MQNDERDRDPRVDETPQDLEPDGGAAEDERSAEEFETVPAGSGAPDGPAVEPQTDAVPPAEEPVPGDAEAGPPAPEETPALSADAGPPPQAETTEWPAADSEIAASRVGGEPAPPPSEAEAYPPPPAPRRDEETAAHSVPATPVGESTQCPRCGTENRPGVAFCRNCGQRLVAAGVAATVQRPNVPEGTQQCPRCGTHNRAGVAFCQNCGANLRVAATPAPGYVPPSASATAQTAAAGARETPRGGALLGPIVLLVAAVGLVTAWLLPFAYGTGSLWEQSFGGSGGYGAAFWNGPTVSGMGAQAYFYAAALAPVLVALLVVLAIAGFLRAAPGGLQAAGIVIALLWALAFVVLFVVEEVIGSWNGDVVALLRDMSPAGIIFLLASLIVLIGGLTRLGRS